MDKVIIESIKAVKDKHGKVLMTARKDQPLIRFLFPEAGLVPPDDIDAWWAEREQEIRAIPDIRDFIEGLPLTDGDTSEAGREDYAVIVPVPDSTLARSARVVMDEIVEQVEEATVDGLRAYQGLPRRRKWHFDA